MVECKGFVFTINVDGNALQEYDPPLDSNHKTGIDDETVIKYIEAVDGKEYTIQQSVDLDLVNLDGCEAVSIGVYVDGIYQASIIGLRSKQFRTCVGGAHYRVKQVDYRQPFKFCAIDVVNSTIARQTKDLQELGVIEIRLLRISKAERKARGADYGKPLNQTSLNIPESQLKGLIITHGTCYGMGQEMRWSSYNTTKIDPEDKPYIKVKFLYCSRASLQILGVIPRDPPAIPLDERDLDSLSQSEAVQLLKIVRENEKKQKQIVKHEHPGDEDDAEPPIKLEERRVKRKMENGETMVLDD